MAGELVMIDVKRLRELLAETEQGDWKLWPLDFAGTAFTIITETGVVVVDRCTKSEAALIYAMRNERPALLDEPEMLRAQNGRPRFCPRHGAADRPIEIPGLRCDCVWEFK